MSVDELEQQKAICDLFIDGFDAIILGREDEFKNLEAAKTAKIQQCYEQNAFNYELCRKKTNTIKAGFLNLEFQLFLQILSDDDLPTVVFEQIKRISIKRKNYSYFQKLGLTLNPEFKMDPKTFFANYKIAKKKSESLQRLIEYQKNNERGPLL